MGRSPPTATEQASAEVAAVQVERGGEGATARRLTEPLAAVWGPKKPKVKIVRHAGAHLPRGIAVREIGSDALRIVINAARPLASRRHIDIAELIEWT